MALIVFCELSHVYSTTQTFIIEIFFFYFYINNWHRIARFLRHEMMGFHSSAPPTSPKLTPPPSILLTVVET